MLEVILKIVLLLTSFQLIVTSKVDDALCEKQLKYFDEALSHRDHWAIYGKVIYIYFIKWIYYPTHARM